MAVLPKKETLIHCRRWYQMVQYIEENLAISIKILKPTNPKTHEFFF